MPQDINSQIIHSIDPRVTAAKQRFGIVGNAPALTAAIERALKVAPIDFSVLITGESGSGKEFFPRIIHNNSARKHNKYIAVNCGAIPEGTIDSELFGHEKGAFTGAIASRKGYFEEANGGTIFLDEVAELPMTTQARLLRVLESGEFIKVGSSEVQKTNIRVVAATNVDMERAVAEGRFREDLYYRLSTVEIHVPPLRERGNDVLLLTAKFLSDFAEKYRTPLARIDDEAKLYLLHYSWPGNVRQLKNVIEQVALFEAGSTIGAEVMRRYLPSAQAGLTPSVNAKSSRYEHEREMLLDMIFRMQREIADLKRRVDENAGTEIPTVITDSSEVTPPQTPALLKYHDSALFSSHSGQDIEPAIMDVEATPHLTLQDTERETIRQALIRNNGNRKLTAQELKISQRTLYRKINEYNLD